MATESFGKILKAAPGWGEKAVWEAFRNPTLKNDCPAPKPIFTPSDEKIKAFREKYGINK